jgi:PAS domain S-box-containing protein
MGLISPDGRYLRVNDALCEITGYTADELSALTTRDLTHPDDREGDWEKLGRMLRGEEPVYANDKRYVRKDGSEVWVSVTATLVRDADGRPVRTIGVVQDLTARRAAEEALRESEDRFRSAFDNAPIGMSLVAPDGRFLQVNRASAPWSATTKRSCWPPPSRRSRTRTTSSPTSSRSGERSPASRTATGWRSATCARAGRRSGSS